MFQIFTDNPMKICRDISKLKIFHRMINFPNESMASNLVSEDIDWHFIPSKSPYFVGLREASVHSVKHNLKQAIGDLCFTYEEFENIAIQIEGVLNS